MSGLRPSTSSDAARARVQARIRSLSDDERLREALRLHDECMALKALFVDAGPRTGTPPSPEGSVP